MRRLLSFACDGTELGATLDAAGGEIGLLLVTGGSQTRIGSHRMYERLAKALARQGISCLRFDRRGVGDSGAADPGFRGSAPDVAAAAGLLRAEQPGLKRVIGFGLCDGATAIALFAEKAGLDGLILVNPWLVEAVANEPPPAAIKRHYRERLLSLDGWKRILSGRVSYGKALRGLLRIGRASASPLAQQVAEALARHERPAQWILATGDATAIAAEAEIQDPAFRNLGIEPIRVETDSHPFARPGDEGALLKAVLKALERLG